MRSQVSGEVSSEASGEMSGGGDWRNRVQVLERDMDEMASAIAHDLRAPLRAVDGFSRAVERQYGATLDAEGQLYLSQIRQGAHALARHIDALVQMARLSVMPLQPQSMDLSQVAREVIDTLRKAAPERRVQVEIQDGLQVEADPTLVRRLLEELLANAWAATREQPDARITVARDAGGGFQIRDNGEGFDRAQARRLFEPFARVRPAREGDNGLAVGLAYARRIVARHGGQIEADSAEGQGATFRFTLTP